MLFFFLPVEDKLRRNLGWKLRLLGMCGIRTWFEFWDIVLKALTGINSLSFSFFFFFFYNEGGIALIGTVF